MLFSFSKKLKINDNIIDLCLKNVTQNQFHVCLEDKEKGIVVLSCTNRYNGLIRNFCIIGSWHKGDNYPNIVFCDLEELMARAYP